MEEWFQGIKTDNQPVLATVESLTNNVMYRTTESLTYRQASAKMSLHAKDTISTDADSSAVIAFKTGLKVELEPNTLMVVEDYGKAGSPLEMTFVRGNSKILNQPAGIKLSGLAVDKTQAQKETPNPGSTPPEARTDTKPDTKPETKTATKPVTTPSTKSAGAKETLPDSYITSVIRNQRTFLNRCYAQRLRLNPDARGRIDTSLTIEPDGTISTARVVGSTISDSVLQQCVVSTLQRAKFKAFSGDPIIVEYPINFE